MLITGTGLAMRRIQTFAHILAAFISLILPVAAYSESFSRTIGDWTLSVDDGYAEAFTSNSAGSGFGYFCTAKACIYYVHSDSTCVDKSTIPALINAESGAVATDLTCRHLEEKNLLVVDYKVIESTTASGQLIGFAIPMADGQFRAIRFSLNGYAAATKAAEEFAAQIAPKQPKPTATDTYL